jgi:uncharacterized protein (TIGR02231 family)
MRSAALAAIAVFIAVPAGAADMEVSSAIDAVTVYPDGATVTRALRADLAAGNTTLIVRDFPPTLDPASLRVEGEGAGGIVIGSIDARPPRADRPATNPEAERRLEALKDQRAVIDDTIASLMARKRFVERFGSSVPLGLGDKADARPLAEWRAAFAAVSEELSAVDAVLRAEHIKLRNLDREIARVQSTLKSDPPRKMEVRIDLVAQNAGAAAFRVSYNVFDARWTPLYDARLDSGGGNRKPALELVRRAEIDQASGEDWNNVALTVSTTRTAEGGEAPELDPLIVRFREQRAARAPSATPPPSRKAKRAFRSGNGRAQEREADVDASGFQVLFRIPGRVSIATHEGARTMRIASAEIEPELLVRAAPALDATAFLEAAFKHLDDAPLLAGDVALYRDGSYVGQSSLRATPKDETVRLGFGADDKVKIRRVIVRKSEGQTGVFTASKVDEREYRITARNGHAQPIKMQIEDQLPVSENQEVVVELLPASTPPTQRDVRERRGVVAWAFEAKPGEAREIKFAWRVRWPADKVIAYE